MSFDVSVNYLAVLVAAISSMVVGSIWYGPLFGKTFMELMGMNLWTPERQAEEKKKMPWLYFGQFVASFVSFYVFAWLMAALGAESVMVYIQGAFWIWLGFILPIQFGQQIWGGKMKLFWLGAGNMLVTVIVAAVILGAWR